MLSLRTMFRTHLQSDDGAVLRTRLRLVLGFLIAPLAPGLLIGAILMLLGAHLRGGGGLAVLMTAYLGYPVALFGGVPLYLFLQWRRWTGWLAYAVAGALLGSCIYGWTAVHLSWKYPTVELADLVANIPVLLFLTGCGLVAGLAFWLIVRPDRAVRRTEPTPRSA